MSDSLDKKDFLFSLFESAVAAADPLKVLPTFLESQNPKGKIIVIGAGKASAAMAKAVENTWPDKDITGVVVTRYDYGMPCQKIKIVEASHPVPDEMGEKACEEIMDIVKNAGENDTIFCLISGGGSALLSMPAPCLSSTEKREINKALLKSGATIHEMNTVRKHLSSVKGGQLALAGYPAKMHTFIISDVAGDDPHVVASGPTLPDPTTQKQALEILEKYNIKISDDIQSWLVNPDNETPKPSDDRFRQNDLNIISKAKDSLDAAKKHADKSSINTIILGDDIEGEAREVGALHIEEAFKYVAKEQTPTVLLSGGETTVTVKGNGRGGRNAEYLLAAFIKAGGHPKISGLAIDTDGIDGSEDNAGAYFLPDTWKKAQEMGLDPQAYLDNNDAYTFFEKVGTLIMTGPTYTNVNDFRAILIN